MEAIDLVGTQWRQEAEETPYRAQNTRMNVQTQVHEIGLKRVDTGDTPGVGFVWLDPMVLVNGDEGWTPLDEKAREAVEKFGPNPSINVMREAALEAVKRTAGERSRDVRLQALALGELVNRGAAYVLEIEARMSGEADEPPPPPAPAPADVAAPSP